MIKVHDRILLPTLTGDTSTRNTFPDFPELYLKRMRDSGRINIAVDL